MTPYQEDIIEVLRRTSERGLHLAVLIRHNSFVDLFQHLLDEIERLSNSEEP